MSSRVWSLAVGRRPSTSTLPTAPARPRRFSAFDQRETGGLAHHVERGARRKAGIPVSGVMQSIGSCGAESSDPAAPAPAGQGRTNEARCGVSWEANFGAPGICDNGFGLIRGLHVPHMPQMPSAPRVRFGEFTADLASQELFRAGTLVRLPNQSFVALAALLERPGQLVTREELRARVWPDNRVVEFEQGLNAVINRLREALGDDAENPKYVETLPRRGYRFIGTARDAEAAATRDVGSGVPGAGAASSAAFPGS